MIKTLRSRRNAPAMRGWATAFAVILLAQLPAGAGEPVLTPQEAATRMELARMEVATARKNIVDTMDQLQALRTSTNARAQARDYSNQVARIEQCATALRDRALEMKRKGDAYFADWEARTAGIEDPQLRQLAEAGYSRRKESYGRIKLFMQEARKNFKPLLSNLKKIQKLLDGPRSQQKVAEGQNLFMRANWNCVDVQRSLMEVESEFEKLAADFGGKRE